MLKYFSGQGKLFIGALDVNGNAAGLEWVGNVPSLTLTFETETLEHKESYSGNRLVDLRLSRENRSRVNATLEQISKENLARLMRGTATIRTGATITNELNGPGLVAGQFINTRFPDVTALTITDSAGVPTTLVLNTNYRITNARQGTIELMNVTSFTQPLKLNYTYAGHELVTMFTEGSNRYYCRFEGLNTADDNRPMVVELYEVQFDPAREIALITDDVAQFELVGSAIYSSARAADAQLGGFGRIILLT